MRMRSSSPVYLLQFTAALALIFCGGCKGQDVINPWMLGQSFSDVPQGNDPSKPSIYASPHVGLGITPFILAVGTPRPSANSISGSEPGNNNIGGSEFGPTGFGSVQIYHTRKIDGKKTPTYVLVHRELGDQLFGHSVAAVTANHANVVVVGAPGGDGYFKIFHNFNVPRADDMSPDAQYFDKKWEEVYKRDGQPGSNSKLGTAVAISEDGLAIAVLAPGSDDADGGYVYTYLYNTISSDWSSMGERIKGPLGITSIDIAQNPETKTYFVATGCPTCSGGKGQFFVYDFYAHHVNSWAEVGRQVTGNEADHLGADVSLAFRATDQDNQELKVLVAIGAPSTIPADHKGRVDIFMLEEKKGYPLTRSWSRIQMLQATTTSASPAGSGSQVQFSRDGKRLFEGSPYDHLGRGRVRIFQYNEIASTYRVEEILKGKINGLYGSALSFASPAYLAISSPKDNTISILSIPSENVKYKYNGSGEDTNTSSEGRDGDDGSINRGKNGDADNEKNRTSLVFLVITIVVGVLVIGFILVKKVNKKGFRFSSLANAMPMSPLSWRDDLELTPIDAGVGDNLSGMALFPVRSTSPNGDLELNSSDDARNYVMSPVQSSSPLSATEPRSVTSTSPPVARLRNGFSPTSLSSQGSVSYETLSREEILSNGNSVIGSITSSGGDSFGRALSPTSIGSPIDGSINADIVSPNRESDGEDDYEILRTLS